MDFDIETIDLAQIEARARKLRADATRRGFASFRDAVASVFASLSLRGSKTA